MECSTTKAPLERPFCCCFVHPHHSWSNRDHSLHTPQPNEASFPRMGVDPWSSFIVQDHLFEHLCPSPTVPWFPGDNRRPLMTRCQPCSSHSGHWLVHTWRTLEELSISPLRMSPFRIFEFLANLDQLSTWGPPGFGLWVMHVHYLSGDCCYQNSGFPYLLFLCRHHCWVMHPQPYHLLGVLSSWSLYLF
jgi:hypothetical protein